MFHLFGTTTNPGLWSSHHSFISPSQWREKPYNYLQAQDSIKWETIFSNEIGRLAKVVGNRIKSGNENIICITINQVPTRD